MTLSNAPTHARPLLMPDEIDRLDAGRVAVLRQGQPPYLLQRLNYLSDRETAGMGVENPDVQGAAAGRDGARLSAARPKEFTAARVRKKTT
jgi:type IV secretory pathway TraG/TraD family ATPase VirD4